MEHLDLAHRRVAGVDPDRCVVRSEGEARGRVLGAAVTQREDIRLQGVQGVRGTRVDVEILVGLLVAGLLQHALELAPETAERGEQGMAHLVVQAVERVAPWILPLTNPLAQDLSLAPDLGPVLARRREDEEMDLDLGRERRQDRHVERRQRRDPEEADPAR